MSRTCAGEGRPASEAVEQPLRLLARVIVVAAAELDEQPRPAVRQELPFAREESEALHRVGRARVEALQADRPVFEQVDDVVRRVEVVGVGEYRERAGRRVLHEANGRAEYERARALGRRQRARDVEAALRKQLVEAVSGHAPWDVRKACPHEVAVPVSEVA
jgi:hypothetical protein